MLNRDDDANRVLLTHVHPADWPVPTPASRYNLVVIGAGTAGLVTAAGAAGLGARVALVERHLMGGDCLNVGCVPSKTLLHAAHVAASVRRAPSAGVRARLEDIDFPAVMRRVREVRARISPHDSAARFRDLGIDVFFGDGRFTAPDTITVEGHALRFHRAVIATGGRAALPPVPGLAAANPLTNETVFELEQQPRRLAIIGGGPLGCELAQAFQRLGTTVTLVQDVDRLSPRDEPEASQTLADALADDGVTLALGARLLRVETVGDSRVLTIERRGETSSVSVDQILVAAGRTPNIEGLGLDVAGITADPRRGIVVDDGLRTSNRRVYAAGDVCLDLKFTHAADAAARLVIQNALFLGRRKASALTIPWCTYTSPEIARVGLSADDAATQGIAVDVYSRDFAAVDRAVTDDETRGFVKVLAARGTGRIVGATIAGPRAGDMIGEVAVIMAAGLGLGRLAGVIHPYPSYAESIRQIGDQYNRTRLTPFVRQLFSRWLKWRR